VSSSAVLPQPDQASADAVRQRARDVLRPSGAFARLDDIAAWLAGWQRTPSPSVSAPALIVFAGDHGVTAEGVSAYPGKTTAEMVRALREGVATASVLAAEIGAVVRVIDCQVGTPTGNIAVEAAMEWERFAHCFELGRSSVRELDSDLLVLGEMGIGNTTAASALAASLFGLTAGDWTGRGTGVDNDTLARKIEIVRRARDRVGQCRGFDLLRELGGAEMVAIVGAIVQARLRSLPVVLDGFVVTAAAALLEALRPGTLDHCIAGHRSPEPGHQLLLERLGKAPLLDLNLRLGEGSGALAAVPLVRMAAAAVTKVATFEEWGLVVL
jgi:nicotinate-nucleotide--dimethylbenzimidazole phosphoribosyltransferase